MLRWTSIALILAGLAGCVRLLDGGPDRSFAADAAPGDGVPLPVPMSWIAITDRGEVAASADGHTWQLVITPWSSARLRRVAHGADGLWVTVGEQGLLATSPDGVTWSVRGSAHGTSAIRAVAHNGQTGDGARWLAGGDGGKLSSSRDGLSWTAHVVLPDLPRVVTLAHDGRGPGGVWVAVSERAGIASSTDGVTWTVRRGEGAAGYGGNAAYGAGAGFSGWVASLELGIVATSPDGERWTPRAPLFGGGVACVLGALVFDAASRSWLATGAPECGGKQHGWWGASADGAQWSEHDVAPLGLWNPTALAARAGVWVLGGNDGELFVSRDQGQAWLQVVAKRTLLQGIVSAIAAR